MRAQIGKNIPKVYIISCCFFIILSCFGGFKIVLQFQKKLATVFLPICVCFESPHKPTVLIKAKPTGHYVFFNKFADKNPVLYQLHSPIKSCSYSGMPKHFFYSFTSLKLSHFLLYPDFFFSFLSFFFGDGSKGESCCFFLKEFMGLLSLCRGNCHAVQKYSSFRMFSTICGGKEALP